jgi:chemotaxis methyl-accepting protein methylase
MDIKAIITKAWEDDNFKQALLNDPKATIEKELGVIFPEDVEIYIHEQTTTKIHLILPQKPIGR